MGMAFLVFVAVALVTLPAYVSAQSAYPFTGSWNGTIGPGTGTISALGSDHQITTSSIVTGTFDGDTTHGSWVGTVSTNYTVPDMSQSGQVSNAVNGTYVMSVVNGTVTGSSSIPLAGQFSGQLTIAFQGQESRTGEVTGTWAGALTVTQVNYEGMALAANISAPGSGQLTATAQSPVPEFSGVAVVAFAALATSLYLLKRRGK
jgi:hypothetical protein